MDIHTVERYYHIKIKPASPLIKSLISKIHDYENRYNMSSYKMLHELRANKIEETGDICNWAHDYRTLKQLRNGKNGV